MDDNAHITDPALRRYLGLEPPLPVVEHPEITDNVLRKYLGLDAYNPNQPRDENGRWTSGNNGVAGSKKSGKVKRKERRGLVLSPQEYGLIHHSLNDYVANHKDKIGDTITWCVGEYGYRVKIINYNEYVPLKKWILK